MAISVLGGVRQLIGIEKMIDIDKQYQTLSGRPVRLFTTDRRDSKFPVVGEWQNQDGTWVIHSWDSTGRFIPNEDYVLDLVEVSE